MKKLKFLLMSLVLIVLLGFSLIFVPVKLKADDYSDLWDAPLSAKNFVDKDGKGIRLYIHEIYGDEESGEIFFLSTRPIKDYYFDDGDLETVNVYLFGKNFFYSNLLNNQIKGALEYWGPETAIPEWDRIYIVYDVEMQLFVLEWYGMNYWNNWIQRCFDLIDENRSLKISLESEFDRGHNEGYQEGYNYGYRVGESGGFSRGYDRGYNEGILVGSPEAYERGYSDGQKSKLAENNAAFYQGLEKWLVPAIIAVIVLGGFVSIAVRKRKEE